MLLNTDLPIAVDYYHSVAPQIPIFEELLQLAFIEVIRKDCHNENADKAQYIQTVLALLVAPTAAVRFEAAATLVFLTSHGSAIKSAASCYIDLAVKESDNSVKLIVLERLDELRKQSDRLLEDIAMDILRVMTSPDLQVRQKALKLVLDLITSRTVETILAFLKKELTKTLAQGYEKVPWI